MEELRAAFVEAQALLDELKAHQNRYPEIRYAIQLADQVVTNLDIYCDAVDLFEAIRKQRR